MTYSVFLDFDGTILPESADRQGIKISDRLLKALNEAKAAGHKIFLNTGRPLSTLPVDALRGFKFDGYLCGSCYINVGGRVLMSDHMTADQLQPVVAHFYGTDTVVLLEGEFVTYAAYAKESEHFLPVSDMREIFKICELEPITKMTILKYLQGDDLEFVREFGDPILRDDAGFTELVPKGHDKAYVVKKTVEYLDLDPEMVIAVGDSRNDIAVLDCVKYPVAMGNASDEVKSHAKYVVPSVEEDGVCEVLENLPK